MISCNKGICEVKGSLDEILADVSVLINSMNRTLSEKFGKIETEKLIRKSVERGFIFSDFPTDDEEAIEDSEGELIDLLEGLLKIVKEIKDGD